MSNRLSPLEFVSLAITRLRTGNYKGIHTVYSGFNEAFKKYFDGADPVETTNKLSDEGAIQLRPVKRGVMLYLPGEAPGTADRAEAALRKMGLL